MLLTQCLRIVIRPAVIDFAQLEFVFSDKILEIGLRHFGLALKILVEAGPLHFIRLDAIIDEDRSDGVT